jgi:hypothetical protein
MRLTGVSFDDAARSVMARFSIQKLDSLVEDLLDSAFGADEHAKQEWRRDAEMRASTKTDRKNNDNLRARNHRTLKRRLRKLEAR